MLKFCVVKLMVLVFIQNRYCKTFTFYKTLIFMDFVVQHQVCMLIKLDAVKVGVHKGLKSVN